MIFEFLARSHMRVLYSKYMKCFDTDMIGQRSSGSRSGSGVQLGTGRGTLRLRSKGPATVEELVS